MADEENIGPRIDTTNPLYSLPIPPVAILLIALSGYFIIFSIFYIIRYFLKTKGACQNDLCSCGPGTSCCQCLENCSDACTCGTPTIGRCLDACCPKRKLDFVGLLLCQCCASSGKPFCTICGEDGPCCSYGDLTCNCACINPDVDGVNCLCCQCGNYNRGFNEDY